MNVSEIINKLKSNWNFGYIDETKIEFEELEELENMETQIRKQLCNEIRENAKYTNWSKAVPFVYVITPEQLNKIEKGEENDLRIKM